MVENSVFQDRLERTHDIPEIFELVKLAVRKNTGKERSGLMLGLSNLGGGPQGFVGAFYPVATNIIVMNTLPLERIKQTDPTLYKPYVFHILLHEYIHTLGIIDEEATRAMALEISQKVFGPRIRPLKLRRTCPASCPIWCIPWLAGSLRRTPASSWSKGSTVPARTCTSPKSE